MKVVFVMLMLVLMEQAGTIPLFSRKSSDWRNPWTSASYRERLQSWGLYPKVFRYGTTNHHRTIALPRKQEEMRWVRRLVPERERQDEWQKASNGIGESNSYDQQFEKFKEELFEKMEQDALEILWQHR